MAKKYHDGAVSGTRRIADIALTVLLAALCVVWMYPVILILINSLKDELAISTATVFEFPTAQTFAGLHNYVHGITQMNFLSSFGYSAIITISSVVLILLCMWILHRTKYGERLFLIGVNPQAAEYSGINTRATIMSTYVLSAVSAAIAGTLLTANVNSAKYDLGSGYTLAIITAVVLGGTLNTGGKGSIIGTVLASLIICILRYGLPLCFGVSTQNLDLPIGLILVVVVLGREIAGQHMLAHLFKGRKKS